MPFFAALYLLLRRGNAFAPEIMPPLRLCRWAASVFAVAALGHVWWVLYYIFSDDIHSVHSVGYLTVVVLDCVMLLTTVAGTQLAMHYLQYLCQQSAHQPLHQPLRGDRRCRTAYRRSGAGIRERLQQLHHHQPRLHATHRLEPDGMDGRNGGYLAKTTK